MSEPIDAAVSYARADQARVETIIAGLKAGGLTVWFDKDIPGGALWEEIIARNYRASGALLFFVSKASLASQRCSEEVSTARTLGKPIIPVLLEKLKLPDDLPDRFVLTLQARNTVDAFGRDVKAIDQSILGALAAFGIKPGEDRPKPPVAAAKPKRASDKPGARLMAFGGAAFAVLLVLGGIFVFAPDPNAPARPAPVPAADPTQPAASAGAPGATPAKPPANPSETIVTLTRTTLAEGEPIAVSVTGLTGQNDEIAVAEAGAAPGTVVSRKALTGTEAALALQPVMRAGSYEVRVYLGSAPGVVRAAAPFTVTPAQPVTLTLEKDAYAEGEPIRVGVAGLPGNERDWIALAAEGAADNVYISYVYTKGEKIADVALKPLMRAGRYEVRAYFDDTTGDKTVRARLPFEVTAYPEPELALDRETYAEGEPITATVRGLPGNEDDWIAVARQGSPESAYLTYERSGGQRDVTVKLKPVMTAGSYEVRVYFKESSGDKTVRSRVRFDVVAATPPVLTPRAAAFTLGEPVLVGFSGMPGNRQDWISIAEMGSPDDAYLYYAYTGGDRDGEVTLHGPMAPGRYEIRAYFDDSSGDKIVRARTEITVEAAEHSD